MTQHDLALLLLKKAREDEQAVDRLLGDAAISDEIVGFHLQQATEKLLKAVLAELDQDIRRTHSLAFLFGTLGEAGALVPDALLPLRELTPFAVEFRYGIVHVGAQPLDRRSMRALVGQLRNWAELVVLSSETGAEER